MSKVVQLRDLGLLRIGAAVPQLKLADVDFNFGSIIETVQEASSKGVQVLVFPEMAITGYTIGDLVQQQVLLSKARKALQSFLHGSAISDMVVILGVPLDVEQKIFNCAVVLNSGRIIGIIPKTFLPSYREFCEDRWFASNRTVHSDSVELWGQQISFGTDILFRIRGIPSAIIGVEICEDLWFPISPHENQALAGATLLVNLSASNDLIGKGIGAGQLSHPNQGGLLPPIVIHHAVRESPQTMPYMAGTL